MEFFESKKAILEHCGKDSKDVRWLDRAIKDGRVWICDGAYYVVSEYVTHLEEENAELEEVMVKWREKAQALEGGEKSDLKLISKAMGEKVLDHGEIRRLEDENIDLRRHLMYLRERNDAKQAAIDGLTQSYYQKNSQQYDFDTAKEKFYALIKYTEDPNEKDERQFAIDNWIILE